MKTRVDVATARPFSSLLTSSDLRDAIAMPSVRHRPSQPKMVAVNRFRSDYPLHFGFIACWSLDTPKHHHEACVSEVGAECIAGFRVDPVRAFLRSPRVNNDGDCHLGYDAPCGFAPVVQQSSQNSAIESPPVSGICLLQIMRFRLLPARLLTTKCVSKQSIRTQRSRN
jgi:hypothetical protein